RQACGNFAYSSRYLLLLHRGPGWFSGATWRPLRWPPPRRLVLCQDKTLKSGKRAPGHNQFCWLVQIQRSPLAVLCENVVAFLHHRVAREPALRIVSLRRFACSVGGLECIGRRVVVECGPSPSAAVREPLAVLHHEINVMLDSGHRWLTGI